MRLHIPVPLIASALAILAILFGLALILHNPEPLWDGQSYQGGIAYIQSHQHDSDNARVQLDAACHYYVTDGMAAADGYTSPNSFLSGCYVALGG